MFILNPLTFGYPTKVLPFIVFFGRLLCKKAVDYWLKLLSFDNLEDQSMIICNMRLVCK